MPARYLVAEVAVLGHWSIGAMSDFVAGRWPLASFTVANIALLGYALLRYVGLRPAGEDLLAPITDRLRRPPAQVRQGPDRGTVPVR